MTSLSTTHRARQPWPADHPRVGKRQRRRERTKRQRAPSVDGAPTTVTIDFDIAEVFPVDDPVGHFVLSIAAAHNDLLTTHIATFPPEEPDDPRVTSAIRVTLLRQVFAQIWETHLLVQKASELAEVDAFLTRVAADYPGELDGDELVSILRGRGWRDTTRVRQVLRTARSTTDHYPKPGTAHIVTALESAAGSNAVGCLTLGERMHTVRAEFADEVLMHAAIGGKTEEELRSLIGASRPHDGSRSSPRADCIWPIGSSTTTSSPRTHRVIGTWNDRNTDVRRVDRGVALCPARGHEHTCKPLRGCI